MAQLGAPLEPGAQAVRRRLGAALRQRGWPQAKLIRAHSRMLALLAGVVDAEGGSLGIDPLQARDALQQRGLADLGCVLDAWSDDSFSALASSAVHDANNLIQIVLALTEQLRCDLPPGMPSHQDIEMLEQAALRVSALHNILLRRVRQPRATQTELHSSVGFLLVSARRLLRRTPLLQLQPVPPAHISPLRLERIVLNLLLNADEVLGEDGRIWIETGTCEGPQPVWLEVRDDGPGVSDAQLLTLFAPRGATRNSGTGGFGLAICQQLAEAAGGRIEARHNPAGQGLAFRLFLPAGPR